MGPQVRSSRGFQGDHGILPSLLPLPLTVPHSAQAIGDRGWSLRKALLLLSSCCSIRSDSCVSTQPCSVRLMVYSLPAGQRWESPASAQPARARYAPTGQRGRKPTGHSGWAERQWERKRTQPAISQVAKQAVSFPEGREFETLTTAPRHRVTAAGEGRTRMLRLIRQGTGPQELEQPSSGTSSQQRLGLPSLKQRNRGVDGQSQWRQQVDSTRSSWVWRCVSLVG